MCHLILLLPLIALPIFWFLPLGPALLIYGAVLLISAWTYWYVMQSMRRPIVAGKEELLHSTGRVLEAHGNSAQVRVHSEIWSAVSAERLRTDDIVEVVGIDGLTLQVRRTGGTSQSGSVHPADPA
jgi:inner membrane protein